MTNLAARLPLGERNAGMRANTGAPACASKSSGLRKRSSRRSRIMAVPTPSPSPMIRATATSTGWFGVARDLGTPAGVMTTPCTRPASVALPLFAWPFLPCWLFLICWPGDCCLEWNSTYASARPCALRRASRGSRCEYLIWSTCVSTGTVTDNPSNNSSPRTRRDDDAMVSTVPDDAIAFSVPMSGGCGAASSESTRGATRTSTSARYIGVRDHEYATAPAVTTTAKSKIQPRCASKNLGTAPRAPVALVIALISGLLAASRSRLHRHSSCVMADASVIRAPTSRHRQREDGEQCVGRAAVCQVWVEGHEDGGDDDRDEGSDTRHAAGVPASPRRLPSPHHGCLHKEQETREQRDPPSPEEPCVAAFDPYVARDLAGDRDSGGGADTEREVPVREQVGPEVGPQIPEPPGPAGG